MGIPIITLLRLANKLLTGEKKREEVREERPEPQQPEAPDYLEIAKREAQRLLKEINMPESDVRTVPYYIEDIKKGKIDLESILAHYPHATDPRKLGKLLATSIVLTGSVDLASGLAASYIHLPQRGDPYIHALAHRIAEGVDHSTLLDETLELLWKHPHEGGYRDILMDYASLFAREKPLSLKKEHKKRLRNPESRQIYIVGPVYGDFKQPIPEDPEHPTAKIVESLTIYGKHMGGYGHRIGEVILKLATLHKLHEEGIVKTEELEELGKKIDHEFFEWEDRVKRGEEQRPLIDVIDEQVTSLLLKYKEHIQKHAPEEERGEAPIQPSEALKIAVREQLPGWAIKTALDEEKRALYTGPEGVHHSLIRYHLIRTSPDHPQGTALHPLTIKLLSEWERELSNKEKPSNPTELLDNISRKTIGKPISEIDNLTYEELNKLANELGIPQNITPNKAREIIKELYRDLKDLEEGRIDPHQLDAEKEASIRHLQLKLLAGDSEPHPQALEIARRNIHTITDLYRELKKSILEETQLGREEQEKLLKTVEDILPDILVEYRNRLGKEKLSKIVADITKKVDSELQKQNIDKATRAWATNLLRNLLLDAPIIAAARDPAITWKPLHEKKKIAAGLAKLYEEDAKRHKIAPISADIYWIHNSVKESSEPLHTLTLIRGRVNSVGNAMLNAHTLFRGLLEENPPTSKGFHSHEVLSKLHTIKKRLMELTYPHIRR